ncbi:ribonuclease H2, subunit B [Podospora fimiseda]|uniref:Ribonuclease H2 subunit B n=1 Tax=Podospora fimiseda TaxID=252190 RepID=A0AAN7BU17_9PEZI|nr:ribonuclease H2, subunit B [Podospora fimiseda]
MARTRSTKPAATGKTASTDKTATTTSASSLYTLPDPPTNPPKLFILPKSATPEARIITLQNPRYSKPTRYLVCPSTGFYEFTKVTTPSPSANPRSWLLTPPTLSPESSSTTIQSPDLFLATPFDPLFLLLPALSTPGQRMFLSPDDHLDALPNPDRHLSEILTWEPTRKLIEQRMAVICDTVEAGDETMYRLNEQKLLSEITSKAKKMAEFLSQSMDEKFVRKALEAPVMGIKSAQAPPTEESKEGTPASGTTATTDSQSTLVSSKDSQLSTASTAITTPDSEVEIISSAIVASPQVISLQRLRVYFNFICSSYISPSISSTLKTLFSSANDFKPLDEYLDQLTKLKQEAAASRSNDFAGKRTRDEEDDEKAEKKRKMEAEEKVKKANQSRGVKKLAKVNTTGMKKMSEFFKKKV